MKYKALLLDYYGTLVEDDDVVINNICKKLVENNDIVNQKQIGTFWWETFSEMLKKASDVNFIKQIDLQKRSLEQTIKYFSLKVDINDLIKDLENYSANAKPFNDTDIFLQKLTIPAVIVSNVDTINIYKSVKQIKYNFHSIITSEDVQSYKPNSKIFEKALTKIGLKKNEVILIGDSLSLDVIGANKFGIDVIWLNRKKRIINEKLNIIANVNCLEEAYDYL